VDLKDKWRNLLRVASLQLHNNDDDTSKQTAVRAGDNKGISDALLARVRQLPAKREMRVKGGMAMTAIGGGDGSGGGGGGWGRTSGGVGGGGGGRGGGGGGVAVVGEKRPREEDIRSTAKADDDTRRFKAPLEKAKELRQLQASFVQAPLSPTTSDEAATATAAAARSLQPTSLGSPTRIYAPPSTKTPTVQHKTKFEYVQSSAVVVNAPTGKAPGGGGAPQAARTGKRSHKKKPPPSDRPTEAELDKQATAAAKAITAFTAAAAPAPPKSAKPTKKTAAINGKAKVGPGGGGGGLGLYKLNSVCT
jgi:hypothetical protein